MNIRPVLRDDRQILSAVLAQAFQQDPVLRWIIPDDSEYQRISETYFELILSQSLQLGESYTNDDHSAVALWVGPEEQQSLLNQLYGTLRLLWLLKGNISRVYQLQELMDSYRPRKDFMHLTYLATHPEHQGSGIGASMLKPILERAKAQSVPVYLECSNQNNLGFYRQFGFRLIDNISFKGGPTIWPMTLDSHSEPSLHF
jgi:ribosomal protein S18 acetylase RimI-like enzyme